MRLVKTTIDCFNSRDGIGLFSGPGRYATLEGRLVMAATQGRTLFEFWGVLLRKMLWPTPPKRMDEEVLSLLSGAEDRLVLKAIASETASVVMLARLWHDEEKTARKTEREELEAEWQNVLAAGGDDA